MERKISVSIKINYTFKILTMKSKLICLCTPADDMDFSKLAFELEADAISYCKRNNDFERVLNIIGKIVKQHIAQAGANDQTQDQGGCDVLDLIGGKFESVFMFEAIENQKKRDGKRHDIHQTVVLEFEPADFKNNGANVLRQMLPPYLEVVHGCRLSFL